MKVSVGTSVVKGIVDDEWMHWTVPHDEWEYTRKLLLDSLGLLKDCRNGLKLKKLQILIGSMLFN